MIERAAHSVNGKRLGMFFKWPDGRQLYIAWKSGEKCRDFDPKRNAWMIDTSLLRTLEARGVEFFGIAHRVRGKVRYYALPVADTLNDEKCPRHFGKCGPQRIIQCDLFTANSTLWEHNIDKAMKMR